MIAAVIETAHSSVLEIPLSHIEANEYWQPRYGGLNLKHVSLLAESDPAMWPPIVVTVAPEGPYEVIDGFHRLEAARSLGLESIRCVIDTDAGYPEAVAANITHGLPLSSADRKIAARWWHDQQPELSYRDIARRVGLSDKTVKSALTESDEHKEARPQRSPVERLVSQLLRVSEREQIDRQSIAQEITAYESPSDIASIVLAIGTELVEAARPFLPTNA